MKGSLPLVIPRIRIRPESEKSLTDCQLAELGSEVEGSLVVESDGLQGSTVVLHETVHDLIEGEKVWRTERVLSSLGVISH